MVRWDDDTTSGPDEGLTLSPMARGAPRRAAGPRDLLEHNRAQLIDGSMKRNHLASVTGMASPTVFRLVDELTQASILRQLPLESGQARRTVGRPAASVELDSQGAVALMYIGTVNARLALALDDRRLTGPVGGDRECSCGRRGCIEVEAQDQSLLADPRRLGIATADSRATDVYDLARSGERTALSLVDRRGDVIARAVAILEAVLDPGVVVIGPRRGRRRRGAAAGDPRCGHGTGSCQRWIGPSAWFRATSTRIPASREPGSLALRQFYEGRLEIARPV